jgi:L-alanine-DL-glutamate epimerase-like enolase superfamily enzyme
LSKIKNITCRPERLIFESPFATSRQKYFSLKVVLVRAESDHGDIGWGEVRESKTVTGETQESILSSIRNFFSASLIGCDPLDLAEVHQRMNKQLIGNNAAKSAVDMAIHDLAGKISGLGVSSILGGGHKGPVNSSKAVSANATDKMVEEAIEFVKAGYKTIKIKTGVDHQSELLAIKEIRSSVGSSIKIKLDANQAWTLTEARNFLSEAEKFDIEMIEQPLPAHNIKGHAELRKSISIPVMLDESIHCSIDLLNVIEKNATDYVNIKLLKTGGLTPAKELASLCSAAGIQCQIGSLDSSIGSAAAVNLVHSCPIIKYAEINGPSRFKNDFASGFRNINGQAVLDISSGLGIKMTLKETDDE